MGIFGNKEKAAAPKGAVIAPQGKAHMGVGKDLSAVILRPRITEKGMLGNENDVYTFEIARSASKYDVRDAVKALWGVTPVKVHVVVKQPRQVMSRARGRRMTVKGEKKAYVYLKKGDKIDLV